MQSIFSGLEPRFSMRDFIYTGPIMLMPASNMTGMSPWISSEGKPMFPIRTVFFPKDAGAAIFISKDSIPDA
jgi:hypothetical protein